jgi:hypothetical protein
MELITDIITITATAAAETTKIQLHQYFILSDQRYKIKQKTIVRYLVLL